MTDLDTRLASLQVVLPDMVVRNLHEALLAAIDAGNADLRGVNPAALRVLAKEFLDFRQEVAGVFVQADTGWRLMSSDEVADKLFAILRAHNPFEVK